MIKFPVIVYINSIESKKINSLKELQEKGFFQDGYARFKYRIDINESYGFVDKNGNVLIENLNFVMNFKNGLAFIFSESLEKWFIDVNGILFSYCSESTSNEEIEEERKVISNIRDYMYTVAPKNALAYFMYLEFLRF